VPKTILLVDDSTTLRHVVSVALNETGYYVIEACDGLDALRKLDNAKVHLIVSGLDMPNMDGISFLRELKKRAEHNLTPVIMMTDDELDSTREKGRDAGVRAWVVKPFMPQQMFAAVSEIVMPWA